MLTRAERPGLGRRADLMDFTAMDAILDALTDAVMEGDDAAIAAFFATHDADPCTVVWSPEARVIGEPALEFLLQFWHAHRYPDGLLPRSAIDPIRLRPALGFIMLLDVIDGGADFRYSLYGSLIAERTGFDWTGRRLSDMIARSFTGIFYAAVYRAVMRRRLPIYTKSWSPSHVAATGWSRLVLPVGPQGGDEAGSVGRFLVGNVPGAWRPPA